MPNVVQLRSSGEKSLRKQKSPKWAFICVFSRIQVCTWFFKVVFSTINSRSLNPKQGHLIASKGSLWRSWYMYIYIYMHIRMYIYIYIPCGNLSTKLTSSPDSSPVASLRTWLASTRSSSARHASTISSVPGAPSRPRNCLGGLCWPVFLVSTKNAEICSGYFDDLLIYVVWYMMSLAHIRPAM